jgi:hypothetical protein
LTATATPVQRTGRRPRWCGDDVDHGAEPTADPFGAFLGGQKFQVGDFAGPFAPLDRLDDPSDMGGQRPGQLRHDVVDLGLAAPHHQVAVDAAVGFGAGPVERGQPVQRALQIVGLEAVESFRGDRRLPTWCCRSPSTSTHSTVSLRASR